MCWLRMRLSGSYGVTAMMASSSEIAETGRVTERSRFRHPEVPSARAAAFRAAGDLQRWAQAVGVDEGSMREALPEAHEKWKLDTRFPEVRARWREKSQWKVLRGRPWHQEENIFLLEARALCIDVLVGCTYVGV